MKQQREIKFRGINPYTDKFEYWSPNCDTNTPSPNDFWDTCLKFQQFTALKDKNGKEIYEGDIVRKRGHLYEIVFRNGAFCLELQNGDYGDLFYDYEDLFYEFDEVQVVGNVYENPELT